MGDEVEGLADTAREASRSGRRNQVELEALAAQENAADERRKRPIAAQRSRLESVARLLEGAPFM